MIDKRIDVSLGIFGPNLHMVGAFSQIFDLPFPVGPITTIPVVIEIIQRALEHGFFVHSPRDDRVFVRETRQRPNINKDWGDQVYEASQSLPK